jgi:hypothetical protein
MIIDSPDVYLAASLVVQGSFYLGKGDRSAFLEYVLENDPHTIKDVARKLKLVTSDNFLGEKIYNDKLC